MEFSERYLGRNDNKCHEIKAGKTKDRQIDIQIYIQIDIQIDLKIDIDTDIYVYIVMKICKQARDVPGD